MQTLNILNENYIKLEQVLGDVTKLCEDDLYDLRYKVNSEISSYYNSSQAYDDFLKLRYSQIYEELTNFDYYANIRKLANKINESKAMNIKEAYKLSYIFGNNGETITESFSLFGDKSNIEIENEQVVYNNEGKKAILTSLTPLYEKVETAFSNLKSNNILDISEGLLSLVNIYYAIKD